MADESYSFSTARTRLEAIVTQVRKKDTSLEKSLDLLEEGVRLANACTELIDHADWVAAGAPAEADCVPGEAAAEEPAEKPSAITDTGDDADPADEAWADDDAEPVDDLGAESDPSADER